MAQGHNALCKEMKGESWAQCHDSGVLTKKRAWLAQGLLYIGGSNSNTRNKKAGCLERAPTLGRLEPCTQAARRPRAQEVHGTRTS